MFEMVVGLKMVTPSKNRLLGKLTEKFPILSKGFKPFHVFLILFQLNLKISL